jgi:hypothetical protein
MAISAPRMLRISEPRGSRPSPAVAVKEHLTLDDPAGRGLDELHDRMGGDAFATAALTHHAQRDAAVQGQIDPVYRPYGAGLEEKVGFEVPDLQDPVQV